VARTAKLFRNGRSQAVRLPSDYRFEGSEVYVRRDPATGDVILSRRPESWEDFFELMKSIDVPWDFLLDLGYLYAGNHCPFTVIVAVIGGPAPVSP
jgi:antitoxin VapB